MMSPEERAGRSAALEDTTSGPCTPDVDDADGVRAMERAVSLVLRVGVVASVGVIGVGLVLMFVHHPATRTFTGGLSYHRLTSPSSTFPHTLTALATSLQSGGGRGIVVLGVLLLILTPVARVAVSVIAFVVKNDALMAGVTLVVLTLLIVSFVLGGRLS